ncbi:hypothetical protein DFP72DRAFT_894650, partial [Ephemerocybe angulata]
MLAGTHTPHPPSNTPSHPTPTGPSAPRSTSPSTSPSNSASSFASLGRSKTSASSAPSTTRPGISQRPLDKRPARREEEGETDGLPPMMRITGRRSWGVYSALDCYRHLHLYQRERECDGTPHHLSKYNGILPRPPSRLQSPLPPPRIRDYTLSASSTTPTRAPGSFYDYGAGLDGKEEAVAPFPSPPALPAAFASSTLGSTPGKSSWLYTFRSLSTSNSPQRGLLP